MQDYQNITPNTYNKVTRERQNRYFLHQSKNYLENRMLQFLPSSSVWDLRGHPLVTFLLCLSLASLVKGTKTPIAKDQCIIDDEIEPRCSMDTSDDMGEPTTSTLPSSSPGFFSFPKFDYPSQDIIKLLEEKYTITGNLSRAEFAFWGVLHGQAGEHSANQKKFMPFVSKPGDTVLIESKQGLEPVIPCRTSVGAILSKDLTCMGWDNLQVEKALYPVVLSAKKAIGKKYNSVFGKFFYQEISKNPHSIIKSIQIYNQIIGKFGKPLLSKNEMDALLEHLNAKRNSQQSFINFCEKTLRLGVKFSTHLGLILSNPSLDILGGISVELFGEKNADLFAKEWGDEVDRVSKTGDKERNNFLAKILKKLRCVPNQNKPCPRKIIDMGEAHLPDDKDSDPDSREAVEGLVQSLDDVEYATLRPRR